MKRIRTIDLFCGAGGSSWGARKAGATIVAGFDRWGLAMQTFAANFPEASPFEVDLDHLDPHNLIDALGRVDLMLASPECTNHGPARGSRARCERSRGTALHVLRFARALEPRWIIIENVTAMRTWDRYGELQAGLVGLGYNVAEVALDSAEFGVPQRRRRLYILCDRSAVPLYKPPRPRQHRNAAAVVDLNGTYKYTPLDRPGRASPTLKRAGRALAALGDRQPFLLVYYGTDQAGGWQRLDRPLRTITTLDRFALVRPSHAGHMMRMLQVPELKKAMGMPKKFKTPFGTRRERIRLLGNAVCPPVMQHLVRCLVK